VYYPSDSSGLRVDGEEDRIRWEVGLGDKVDKEQRDRDGGGNTYSW
jgi:hypothetical protein